MKKTVTILRGVPGSGKSTYAQQLREQDRWFTEVVSADSYFVNGMGEYKFDPTKLSEAHGECFKFFLHHVIEHAYDSGGPGSIYSRRIIVDNTNTTATEIAPYVLAANAFGWDHEIVKIVEDPIKAHSRNVHGVPRETIERMSYALMSERLPPFWNREKILAGNLLNGEIVFIEV